MQIGLSSYTFPWAVAAQNNHAALFAIANQLLDYTKTNGLGYLQFGDNLPLHEFSEAELSSFSAIAKDYAIQIQAGTKRLTRENIHRYIIIAKKIASPFVRMVIDDTGYHPPVEDVMDVINDCLPALQENNIMLAIENHDRFSAAMLEKIILKTDKRFVAICLDTANSLGAGEGIEHVVKTLGPYTINLHVKDFVISRLSHKMGFKIEGSAAGDGMLDIKWLINELKQYKRCDTATLEIWSGEERTMAETIGREKHWAEKSIRYLKNIIV